MSVVDELINIEDDGTISFGNYLLNAKTKKDNVEYNGDIYKVKTFNEITKLERNGMFVYESVPGTTVHNLGISDDKVEKVFGYCWSEGHSAGLYEVFSYAIELCELLKAVL